MNETELKSILARSFVEDRSRAGETPLDKLVRRMLREAPLRLEVEELLFGVVGDLHLTEQWRGLDILIGQTSLKNQALGEKIETLIGSNEIDLGRATVWPARCALELGAALTDATLKRLDQEDITKGAPLEKFSLIARTSEAKLVAKAFESIPRQVDLTPLQATEIIRIFKREAAKLRIEPNGPLSVFFDVLAPEIALPVAATLKGSISPSYEIRSRERAGRKKLRNHEIFKTVMEGIEKITKKTEWSRQQAQNEHRPAA
jgi:hypothetical protein